MNYDDGCSGCDECVTVGGDGCSDGVGYSSSVYVSVCCYGSLALQYSGEEGVSMSVLIRVKA